MATKLEALLAQQESIKKQILEARKAAEKQREIDVLKLLKKHELLEQPLDRLDLVFARVKAALQPATT